jgi:hypothetical protein
MKNNVPGIKSINVCTTLKMNSTLKIEFIEFRKDEDIYFGVFESDPITITLIVLSTFLSIFFLIPLFIAFLWYDYFGPHSERVILNRLLSSLFETSLAYLIFVHSIDISRYVFGPFSGDSLEILSRTATYYFFTL